MLVPLGASGRFAIVDACDAPRVLQHRWHLKRVKNSPRVYAQRTIRLGSGRSAKKTAQSLHRFVWGESAPALIDHRDGDGLNCRRENLREATPRQNATNVTSSKRQKRGGYKGVTWHAGAGKWQASICAGEIRPNGKRKQLYLGCFTDPIDAARAYDAAALEHFGEFASVNFPQRESAA